MATSQVHLLELNVVHCRETVRMRLLRFWEALNVKKAGELMVIDMLLINATVSRNLISIFMLLMLQEASQNYGLVTLLSRLDLRVVPITLSFLQFVAWHLKNLLKRVPKPEVMFSAQAAELLGRVTVSFDNEFAAFQVVWMGGVVNSTRSNRFTNGLNTTHDAAFFYSSTAGVYQEPWARHVFEQLGTCLGKLNSLRGFDPFLYKTSVRGQLRDIAHRGRAQFLIECSGLQYLL
ncbi:hypothetical protein YC2023_051125 [Brassica napus]